MSRGLLRVESLSTRFFTEEGQVNAVEDVSFTVEQGEVFGIVGESGSGKSVTALSLLDLVESPGRITDGEIWHRNPNSRTSTTPSSSTVTTSTSSDSPRRAGGRSAGRRSR